MFACGLGTVLHNVVCVCPLYCAADILQVTGCLAKHVLPVGEGEDVEDDEQKGPELKQASRRDMYTICQTAGLGKSSALSR